MPELGRISVLWIDVHVLFGLPLLSLMAIYISRYINNNNAGGMKYLKVRSRLSTEFSLHNFED